MVTEPTLSENSGLESIRKWIPRNLEKILQVSSYLATASVSFAPTLAAGVAIAFSMGNGLLRKIEADNVIALLKEYVDSRIDEKINPNDSRMKELIYQAFLSASHCHTKAQIRRINDILCSKANGEIPSYNDAEDYINVISELSTDEAVFLVEIYHWFESNHKLMRENASAMNVPHEKVDYLLNRLEAKGLIRSESIDMDGENDIIIENEKFYFPTKFGKKFFQSFKTQ